MAGIHEGDPLSPQDDDLAAVTIVTGTTSTEERCHECGGTIPAGGDTAVTIGLSRDNGFVTVRFRCISCQIDQD